LKEESPHDKHWLSIDACEAIREGQAAQQDVAVFLQGVLGDSYNDGQVTKQCKNCAEAIDSNKENVVDIGSLAVRYDASAAWQTTNCSILMKNHAVAWSNYM